MKIAIVGSRDFPHLEQVIAYVNALPLGTRVISGGARGVDKAAEQAALKRYDLEVEIFPADWQRYGKSAGYRRNADIVAAADKVVAFWDGKSSGTKHTVSLARKAGKPVEIYYADGRIEKSA